MRVPPPFFDNSKNTGSGPLFRFEILRRFAGIILPSYRLKWPQMAWWQDAWFNSFLKDFDEHKGMNTDRKWMLYQLMRLVATVPGDTAECGVFRGASSYIMCRLNQMNTTQKRMHLLFDSFEGLSEPEPVDGKHWKKGDLACGEDAVRARLSEFKNLLFYKGWIPERFPEAAERKFAFIHVDVDIHQPTRDCIAFFYPRMQTGGIVLCDDYGFTSCPGATRACDEFLADKPEKMVSLCSGGGFFVKGCVTAPALALDHNP